MKGDNDLDVFSQQLDIQYDAESNLFVIGEGTDIIGYGGSNEPEGWGWEVYAEYGIDRSCGLPYEKLLATSDGIEDNKTDALWTCWQRMRRLMVIDRAEQEFLELAIEAAYRDEVEWELTGALDVDALCRRCGGRGHDAGDCQVD